MRAKRVDLTQQEIVHTLRQAGCSVFILSSIGHGCPDLAVGIDGHTLLLECKTGKAGFTEAEVRFREHWQGSYATARSGRAALLAVLKYLTTVGKGKVSPLAKRRVMAAVAVLDEETEALERMGG